MIRPEFIIEELRRNMPEADIEMVWRAYAFAAKCHKGQKRVSGEPYLNHPLEVANILAHMKLGYVSVSVALLHDTIEDTEVTAEEIKNLFGEEVMQLVDGVTKISQLKFSSKEEHQAENFRKMILAMSKDIRVILVKLADRIRENKNNPAWLIIIELFGEDSSYNLERLQQVNPKVNLLFDDVRLFAEVCEIHTAASAVAEI